jgi:hypothetical protein
MALEIDAGQERLELWLSSVAAYHGKCREENIAAWRSYHLEQAERLRRTMEPLIAFHEAQAAQLEDVCSKRSETN